MVIASSGYIQRKQLEALSLFLTLHWPPVDPIRPFPLHDRFTAQPHLMFSRVLSVWPFRMCLYKLAAAVFSPLLLAASHHLDILRGSSLKRFHFPNPPLPSRGSRITHCSDEARAGDLGTLGVPYTLPLAVPLIPVPIHCSPLSSSAPSSLRSLATLPGRWHGRGEVP